MIHTLKIKPCYLLDIHDGTKTFEVRKADRPYAVGDTLLLREYPESGMGLSPALVTVTYVLYSNQFPGALCEGYCVLGIQKKQMEVICGE